MKATRTISQMMGFQMSDSLFQIQSQHLFHQVKRYDNICPMLLLMNMSCLKTDDTVVCGACVCCNYYMGGWCTYLVKILMSIFIWNAYSSIYVLPIVLYMNKNICKYISTVLR